MNKRDAINEILLSLNELPLDVSDAVEDIGIAVIVDKELDIAKKKILAQGWFFNKMARTLYPNTSGYIVIPESFLSVDGGDNETTLMVRDWKLFDKAAMSYLFEEPKECIVTEDIVFDDLPFHAANYVVQTASLQAYINIIGNSEDIQLRASAVQLAKIEALRDNANNVDGNILAATYASNLLDRTGL